MKKSSIVLISIGVVLLFLVFYVVSVFNGLQRGEVAVNGAWANVESDYQRRMDLIPNYVNIVKGYAAHEKNTLIAVTEARAKVGQVKVNINDAKAIGQFQAAQGELSSALSKLMVVVENYPQLKANESFLKLQDELAGTENRINVSRKRFNEAAQAFNINLKVFPRNLVNSMFAHFTEKAFFKAEDSAKQAPQIKF